MKHLETEIDEFKAEILSYKMANEEYRRTLKSKNSKLSE